MVSEAVNVAELLVHLVNSLSWLWKLCITCTVSQLKMLTMDGPQL